MGWVKLGDRVRIVPATFGNGVHSPGESHDPKYELTRNPPKPLPGTVTYVHPTRPWYQVTFDNGIVECFFQKGERDGDDDVQT